jgi:ribosomal 50S subunit-recycling heat shock protein
MAVGGALLQDALAGGRGGRPWTHQDRPRTSSRRVPSKLGDKILIDNGSTRWEVVVLGLSDKRGPAPVAQALYRETEDSIAKRANDQEARRLFPEPGSTIKGRPPSATAAPSTRRGRAIEHQL